MPIVGTAGHVDHGKSSLVLALTGRDPDRWEEEKRRGLTIDLGFGWCSLPSGIEVGFVDVPGHQRFVKNMLAGIEAIDVALFVVAADEGWKPQSEEHLGVLDLLGIQAAVVALTKVDLVSATGRAAAREAATARLEATALASAEIVEVSVVTGEGLQELQTALDKAVGKARVPDWDQPRLWVDRVFAVPGAGTVVTGTLVEGTLRQGDELMAWPAGVTARVRKLERHQRTESEVGPGNRTAVNLVGIDRNQLERGSMLGRVGGWRTAARPLVDLRTVRGLPTPLRERGAFHLHLGTQAQPIGLHLLEGFELEGRGGARLVLSQPLPLAVGDRFIIREVGRQAVVAGGVVLDPSPPARLQITQLGEWRQLIGLSPHRQAAGLLELRGRERIDILAAHTRGGVPPPERVFGETALSVTTFAQLRTQADQLIRDFQQSNPLRPGMPKAELAGRVGLPSATLEAVLASDAGLVDEGVTVRSTDFSANLSPADAASWEAAAARLAAGGWAVPRIADLGLSTPLLHALVREEQLVRVGQEFAYLPSQLDELGALLTKLPDGFTVAQFRDAAGLSRKYAVPLLEFFDRAGLTLRNGDLRSVRAARAG